MKRIIALIFLLLPTFAWAGPDFPENEVIGQQSGALVEGRVNEGATPIATPVDGTSVMQSHNRYGDAFVVIRAGSQTPLPTPALAGMTPATMAVVNATAVPTAYTTPQFPNSAALKSITVDGSTSSLEIWCGFGATTDQFAVPAGGVAYFNFAENGVVMSTDIRCHAPTAPGTATGTIKFYGYN